MYMYVYVVVEVLWGIACVPHTSSSTCRGIVFGGVVGRFHWECVGIHAAAAAAFAGVGGVVQLGASHGDRLGRQAGLVGWCSR